MEQIKMYIQNGIYHSIIDGDMTIDINTAKLLIEKRTSLLKDKKYPGYFDISKLKYESKEAREYLAKHGYHGIIASAIIAKTTLSKIFITTYLAVYPTNMPCKIFTDKEKAEEWLQQFKAKID